MSRSGYSDECESPECWLWPSIVRRAIQGKRGQAFLIALRDALEALPEKRLIADELESKDGQVCALGALGKARQVDLSKLDPHDPKQLSAVFGIAPSLAQTVVFHNDDDFRMFGPAETPEKRYTRMLEWVNQNIVSAP